MADTVYRVPFKYWIASTIVVGAVLSIPIIAVVAIPGFPHPVAAAGHWRHYYSKHAIEAVALLFVWAGVVGGFGLLAWPALRALIAPQYFSGIFEEVEEMKPGPRRTLWVQLSGVRRKTRYDARLYQLLKEPKLKGMHVVMRLGVGDRTVSVEGGPRL